MTIRGVPSLFVRVVILLKVWELMLMIIDSHVHISIYNKNAASLEEVLDLFLKVMKKNGIISAIIIPDNIEGSDSITDLDKAIKLIGQRKNLFLLGSPQIIQRGSNELEKYQLLIKEGKINGLKFFPGHDPYYPTDERCLPYYELCEKLDIPVLFHTGENSGDSECAKWNDPIYIVEIAKKYPELKVIITHYYWPKLDYCYEITKEVSNIYFELAALADKEVVEKSGGREKIKEILRKTIFDRPDKVIFGTDWPMCEIEDHIELVKSLGLSKIVEEKVFYKNSMFVYKLDVAEQK
jgi:predicted TIM-barrel fold metal-dependent hydrolase